MMTPCDDKMQLASLDQDHVDDNTERKKELGQPEFIHVPQNSSITLPVRRKKVRFGIALCLSMLCIILLALLSGIFMLRYGPSRKGDIKVIVIKNDDKGDDVVNRILGKGLWKKIIEYIKLKEHNQNNGITNESRKTVPPIKIEPTCSDVADNDKFDCDPNGKINEKTCLSRGCCWKAFENPTSSSFQSSSNFPPLNVPYCYFPFNYIGYNVTNKLVTENQIIATLKRVKPSGYPNDIDTVVVKIRFHTDDTLSIKITDIMKPRFEVPKEIFHRKFSKELPSLRRRQYNVQFKDNGELIITRLKNNQIIFHTDLSRMIYSDQFLQLSSRLPSKNIYGLGVHKAPLLRDVNWKRFTFFNRDRSPTENINLYGSHPFYLALENDGNSHGVFLLNSNAMDVILQPTPAITYRTIGGIFDFYVFLGPFPDEVVHQYSRVIGTTFMPPYWSLGFHLCKWNYGSLNKTKAAWNRTRSANIPLDAQWNDIDYMINHNDFTYDKTAYKGLPEFVKEIHDIGMHYVVIVDPGISNAEPKGSYPPYDEGLEMDVFVKNSTGQIFIGKVWNKVSTVYPDFTHPQATEYWTRQFQRYHDEVQIDGAWIDMNEPSNFYNGQINGCPNSTLENPIYVPGGNEPLRTKTLCMTAEHHAGLHYDIHNLYAFAEAIATNAAMTEIRKKRAFAIARASFPGIGSYAGVWSGDISSSWDNMRWSIPALLNMNMFGIPMTGSDICGFSGNTTVEMCARWSALGAFYPFSRNHNTDGTIEQDPANLGPVVASAARKSLITRYYLLPYIYTLFYKSHVFGSTVARPLFFEYPRDNNTYAIDRQFLLGPSLMVLPVLDPNVTTVSAYFPSDTWYDFYSGQQYQKTGTNIVLDAPKDKINLAIRGGSIIPAQTPALTTTQSRLNNFTLIVAPDETDDAIGELYWDDGDSIDTFISREFTIVGLRYRKNSVFTNAEHRGYTNVPLLEKIVVFGCSSEPKTATVNKQSVPFSYDSTNKVLTLEEMGANLLETNTIEWE